MPTMPPHIKDVLVARIADAHFAADRKPDTVCVTLPEWLAINRWGTALGIIDNTPDRINTVVFFKNARVLVCPVFDTAELPNPPAF